MPKMRNFKRNFYKALLRNYLTLNKYKKVLKLRL
jgi:hypothetical protein